MDEKAKRAAQCGYDRFNPKTPKPSGCRKPDNKKKPKGKLQVQHHGIPKCHHRTRKLKCAVCREIFTFMKDFNNHVCSKHTRFRYKCEHCTQKVQNYAGCYKHQKMHLNAPHVCKTCQKGFWCPMKITVHEHTHSRTGLFRCINCPSVCTTCPAMDTHRVTHQGKRFIFPKCPYFSTDTQPNLRQHNQGNMAKVAFPLWTMF